MSEPLVAFLRGVNLGKRTVRSAELVAAFADLGFAGATTLIASGNVRFRAARTPDLARTLEAGLAAHFGFPVPVVLRSQTELRAIVASDPFARAKLGDDARPHGVLFDDDLPASSRSLASVAGDYDIIRVDRRELYLVGWRQPQGGLGKQLSKLLAELSKHTLSTARAWNTLVKAAE